MTRLVLLDSGPLGLLVHPKEAQYKPCLEWATNLRRKGAIINVPEIIDYELRRELIRINSGESLAMLDELGNSFGYLPLTTDAMRLASDLWAQVRIVKPFKPTAEDAALDADMILCAQAKIAERAGFDVWIATGNVGDLVLHVPQSCLWEEISP